MKKGILLAMMTLGAQLVTLPSAWSGVFNPKTAKLSNGLQVVLVENHLSPVVSVSLIYKIGTADDPVGMHGLSHFLEHLMFKGTKEMPADQFKKIISSRGGNINAFTTPDLTAYICDISVDQLDFILKLEADRMQNLVMDVNEVKAEQKVVLEERYMRLDNNPFGVAYEGMLRATYWYHPYGIPAIGYPHHINAYTRDAAYEHYKKWYAPNNAILVVSGDIKMEKLQPMVEKYFNGIPSRCLPARHRPKELDHAGVVIELEQESPRFSLTHVSWSYSSPNHIGEDGKHYYPLLVLQQILGGNATSRLYRELVEGHAIAVEASCSYDDSSLDPQTFSLSATLAPDADLKKLKSLMNDHVQDVVKKGITDKELADAKRDLLAGLAFARDGNNSSVMSFTRLAVGFTVEEIEDWPNKINAVTTQQVNDAAKFVLGKPPVVIITIYPKGAKKKAQEVSSTDNAPQINVEKAKSSSK